VTPAAESFSTQHTCAFGRELYQLFVERTARAAMLVTSNRDTTSGLRYSTTTTCYSLETPADPLPDSRSKYCLVFQRATPFCACLRVPFCHVAISAGVSLGKGS
jgi:hypothetical protein